MSLWQWIVTLSATAVLTGCAAERRIRIGAEHSIEQRETKVTISAEFTN